jgi:predicted DNA-binding transcriptional regulator AlpA
VTKNIKAELPTPSVRLLCKTEVLAITGVTYPTVWKWMRDGTFPRSRIAGGRSMWFSSDVESWLAGLQIRPLKGDPVETRPPQ